MLLAMQAAACADAPRCASVVNCSRAARSTAPRATGRGTLALAGAAASLTVHRPRPLPVRLPAASRGAAGRTAVCTVAAVRVHCFVDDDAPGPRGGRNGGGGIGHVSLSSLASAGYIPKGSVAERLLAGAGGNGGPGDRGRGGGGGGGGGRGDDEENENRMRWIWRVRSMYDPVYCFTVMLLHFAAAWLLMVLVVWETTRRRDKAAALFGGAVGVSSTNSDAPGEGPLVSA